MRRPSWGACSINPVAKVDLGFSETRFFLLSTEQRTQHVPQQRVLRRHAIALSGFLRHDLRLF
jgi:hypothetical protein